MAKPRGSLDDFIQVEVPPDVLWGIQTARCLHFFAIGQQKMPLEIVHAIGWIKWAAALTNRDLGLLEPGKANAIATAARAVAQGEYDHEFPLGVWQTGSGTHTHMNVNEVVAHLATNALTQDGHPGPQVHPNDDVNLGQSSNDVFPSAMHMAVVQLMRQLLLPTLLALCHALRLKASQFEAVIKIGRTHLQDAVPLTLGQEFGGYEAQLSSCEHGLSHAMLAVYAVAMGGTAVGTGLNTHPEFGARITALLAGQLELPLVQASNLFAAMAGHEALVQLHGSLRALAVSLIKIANDLRLLASGPRAGLGELRLPQNEPGSSIMPGKVNPSQIEALTMVCIQVLGHDAAVGFAASQGQLELNAYKPLIALNTLDSIQLLADAMCSFTRHCVVGIAMDPVRIDQLLQGSLMLATALAPHTGYDVAARIARHALDHNLSLRDAALALGSVSPAQFDAWVDPKQMLGPHPKAPA